jgi:hypothetical protein
VSGGYAGAEIAHFGHIRGTDDFKDHDVVIILGRQQISPRDAEKLAKAIWYDTKRPIDCITADEKGRVDYPKSRRPYVMRDGSPQSVKVKIHPDRRARRWWNRYARQRWSRRLIGCASSTARGRRRSASSATSP